MMKARPIKPVQAIAAMFAASLLLASGQKPSEPGFPAGIRLAAKARGEAASHEAGHTLGLSHDGVVGGAAYYPGQGNWGIIMGVSYNKPISQWSKGEYADANNTQDDLAIMLSKGAVYRPDDHGGAIINATKLSADSRTTTVAGVIERRTDLDFFRIAAAGGSLVVDAKPTPLGPNLRLVVKLYDSGVTGVFIEVGENLVDWPDLHPVPDIAVANNPGLTVQKNIPVAGKDTITLTLPLAPDKSNFARLKVMP